MTKPFVPEILAPAGGPQSLLAAMAAGADAAYLGLKHFSARMAADNFSLTELARLAAMARDRGVRLYMALNTLLKPGDLDAAGRLMHRLQQYVQPDALIVQDLGAARLARQAGYAGELHFSTLANCTHQAALGPARQLGASRVVLPRELSIDEIKSMAEACPDDMGPDFGLEVFIHGALCYCVSGRCYWSSYMGGKSGLRGRCVQPCRRVYKLKGRQARFFSCLDLSLDVLVKTLLAVPQVKAWKIEGRKKGPHYVYYTVTAYRMLRDHGHDPQARKEAQRLLETALGRPGSHYRFLPQRQQTPVQPEQSTSSGLTAGKIIYTPENQAYMKPFIELLPGDLLRIGTEDEPWHCTWKVRKFTPKRGRLDLKLPGKNRPKAGTLVALIDRQEKDLLDILRRMEAESKNLPEPKVGSSSFAPRLPSPAPRSGKAAGMTVLRFLPPGKQGKPRGNTGLWLTPATPKTMSRTLYDKIWWALPPVIWPDNEETWTRTIHRLVRDGGRRFICNAPWQVSLFPDPEKVELMAGPFCNVANGLAVQSLAGLGFSSAVVSPELGREDFLALPAQSPLPLGVVVAGYWPMGISRTSAEAVKPGQPLESPKGEVFWTRINNDDVWVYPNWPLDLTSHKNELEQAGYSWTMTLVEPRPKTAPEPTRTSEFNWDHGVL